MRLYGIYTLWGPRPLWRIIIKKWVDILTTGGGCVSAVSRHTCIHVYCPICNAIMRQHNGIYIALRLEALADLPVGTSHRLWLGV